MWGNATVAARHEVRGGAHQPAVDGSKCGCDLGGKAVRASKGAVIVGGFLDSTFQKSANALWT
eukprot:3285933-Prymnesium_polylepis.1